MGDSPPQGASAVNDELEVGFSADFEGRWRKAEIVGRVVMVAGVAAALAGLLGQGPWSHRTSRTPDGRLSVDYEPVARYDTGTQVTLHLSARSPDAGGPGTLPVRVSVATQVVEPMGLQLVVPRPEAARAGQADITWTFELPAGEPDALVRLMLKPVVVGTVHLWARQGNGETLAWTQLVLP